jgi:secondary thiamine-phosphate synthase enzyme
VVKTTAAGRENALGTQGNNGHKGNKGHKGHKGNKVMKFYQQQIVLPPFRRGFHLITKEVERAIPEIKEIKRGLLQVFIKHTSASLTINENADPSVRTDFESHFNQMVPENAPYYEHDTEGSDDMPAHIKASLLGASVTIPITNGKLNTGIWQGIYLCEHRDQGGSRELVITAFGQ